MLNLKKYKILLCSRSPRRQELLKMLDIDFEIAPSIEVEETYPADMPAAAVPLYLSALKAKGYAPLLQPDTMLITADTIVINDGEVVGKPKDEADARRMLAAMSGKTHTVVTGVTVTTTERQVSFDVTTRVSFDRLSDEEIDYYVKRYSPLDKAGAYGIQEWIGAVAVSGIEGSFYNVMGLPVHQLYLCLKDF